MNSHHLSGPGNRAQRLAGSNLGAALLLLAVALMLPAGCSVIRGIPTHGGGKRFDEEQRIVAGAIRRALADMDLRELSGRNVLMTVESLANSGGGYQTFPGLSSISAGYNDSDSDTKTKYSDDPVAQYYSYRDNLYTSLSKGFNANAAVTPHLAYSASAFATDTDTNYLKAALTMKMQLDGINVVTATPDCVLYVLVDVLGLNRSRHDSIVYWRDELTATCELTYYVLDAKTGKILFRARRASAQGHYNERSIVGFTAYRSGVTIERTTPTELASDGYIPELLPKTAVAATTATQQTLVVTPPAKPLDDIQRTAVEAQRRDADQRLNQGQPAQAGRLIEAIRATDPGYPGLTELEDRLRRLQTKGE